MNIGLFGGTFNPLHNGHIGIIQFVKTRFNLEKIFLIPSATPPHKPDTDLAPARDRFDMVSQSIEEMEGLLVSDKELVRKGKSYTIDTIHDFKKELGRDTDLYLLMGSDAFMDIKTWKKNEEIFTLVSIVIMVRKGAMENLSSVVSFIDENISKDYTFKKKTKAFHHERKKTIFLCDVPKIDISSTMVRKMIKTDQDISGLVPVSVENMIKLKGLYR